MQDNTPPPPPPRAVPLWAGFGYGHPGWCDEATFAVTDALVATGWIGAVGVNCYPHDATVPPGEGICWYPWLDQPVWGRTGARCRWPCGWRGDQPVAQAA